MTPETYLRIFEQHADGRAILEDLTARFFDGQVYVAGEDGKRETDRRAAHREVVHFILRQIALAKQGSPNDEETTL